MWAAQNSRFWAFWGTWGLAPTAKGTQLELAADLGLILTQIGAVETPEQPQFVPRSIPEDGDPKLGAAVKIAIWQRQNLYLEHIGSDRRIFSQDLHPMSYKTSRRGPS